MNGPCLFRTGFRLIQNRPFLEVALSAVTPPGGTGILTRTGAACPRCPGPTSTFIWTRCRTVMGPGPAVSEPTRFRGLLAILGILMTANRRRRRSGSECVRCSGLTEFREEFADTARDRGVSLDLAGPAAFDRVLDETAGEPGYTAHEVPGRNADWTRLVRWSRDLGP